MHTVPQNKDKFTINKNMIESFYLLDTVKPVIRVDFLFFLFGISLDSYYGSTLITGRLSLICLIFFVK